MGTRMSVRDRPWDSDAQGAVLLHLAIVLGASGLL